MNAISMAVTVVAALSRATGASGEVVTKNPIHAFLKKSLVPRTEASKESLTVFGIGKCFG
jgi:hypothetical protein